VVGSLIIATEAAYMATLFSVPSISVPIITILLLFFGIIFVTGNILYYMIKYHYQVMSELQKIRKKMMIPEYPEAKYPEE